MDVPVAICVWCGGLQRSLCRAVAAGNDNHVTPTAGSCGTLQAFKFVLHIIYSWWLNAVALAKTVPPEEASATILMFP
jgi:hypothetical protein